MRLREQVRWIWSQARRPLAGERCSGLADDGPKMRASCTERPAKRLAAPKASYGLRLWSAEGAAAVTGSRISAAESIHMDLGATEHLIDDLITGARCGEKPLVVENMNLS